MRAEHAKVIADFLVSNIEYEISITTSVFAAVPVTRLGYRPHAKSKSALELLRHLTLEDEWILNAVVDGQFSPLPDDSEACGIMTPSDSVARYNERIPAVLARVRALPAEALTREVDMLGFVRMPAVAFLSLMVRHSAHHRGQLSSYLRPMGAKVPSIYGPTADTHGASL